MLEKLDAKFQYAETSSDKIIKLIIGRIAMMVTKYLNKTSDKYYLNSLQYSYNEQAALDEFKTLAGRFKIGYGAIKKMKSDDLVACLSDTEVNPETKYLMSQAHVYLCRNTTVGLDYVSIIDLIKSADYNKAKRLWMLGYTIESKVVDSGLIAEINFDGADEDAKEFFLDKFKSIKTTNQLELNAKTKKTNNNRAKNKLVVSKMLQTVKTRSVTNSSEQTDIRVLNLASALKSRNKLAILEQAPAKFEKLKDEMGNDRSKWSTWAELINLYNLAAADYTIKSDDKDNYLSDKFLGKHSFSKNEMIHKFKESIGKKDKPLLESLDGINIVSKLKDEKYNLSFKDVSRNQLESLDQEELKISEVKYSLPINELEELANKGIERLIEINEKKFIPRQSIAIVTSLGLVQICAGGFLMATGFGLSAGIGLIAEGISDLVYVYTAYTTRQFNWHSYCMQKAVSISLSLACVGFDKLKDASKAVFTLTNEVSKEALKQAQFVSSGKTIAQQIIKSRDNLKSLTLKYVGTKVGEAVARESLNTGVKYLSNFLFELIKPQIIKSVQLKVKLAFNQTSLNSLLRKMYAIDENMLKTNIKKIVADVLNLEKNTLRKHWNSIGLPLIKGILSNPQYLGDPLSMALRIAGTLQGLNAIQTIIDNVYLEMVTKLTSLDRNNYTMTHLLNKYLKIEKEQARKISKVLVESEIIDSNYLLIAFEDIKSFNKKIQEFELKNKQQNENVALYLKVLYDRMANIKLDMFDFITHSVSDKITDQVIRIIESELITRWSTLAVSCGVNALSVRLQHYALVDNEQNTDSQNFEQKKYDSVKQKQVNNEALTYDEKNFMNLHGSFNTLEKQLQSNSKDYCVSYEQREIAYSSQKINEFKPGEKASQEQIDIANKIREKKPASIAELTTLALNNGIKLKTTDDKNYQRTPEEVEAGVEVIFIEKGEKDANNFDGVGHAYFMDANGNFVDVTSEPNDCLYRAFSAILEKRGVYKSTSGLRNETADTVLSNKIFASVINAERWIQERYPQEANTFLLSAGLKVNPIDNSIEVEDKDIQELHESLFDKTRGERAAEKFKASVPKDKSKISPPLGSNSNNFSLHHISPNPKVEELLGSTIFNIQSAQNANDQQTVNRLTTDLRNDIEYHLNQAHIRDVIINGNLININNFTHGNIIHAAYSNNPHNLVFGPSGNYRAHDPARGRANKNSPPSQKIDTEILNLQNPNYRNAFNIFNIPNQTPSQQLRNFSNLPSPDQLNWVLDSNGNYIARN